MVRCFRWGALGGVGEAGGGLRRVSWNGPTTAPDPAGNPPGGLRPQTPSLDELALAGALRQQATRGAGWAGPMAPTLPPAPHTATRPVVTAAPSMSHHGHRGGHRGAHRGAARSSPPPHRCRTTVTAARTAAAAIPTRGPVTTRRWPAPARHPSTWPHCITFAARPVACEPPRRGGDGHLATPGPGRTASPSRLALSRASRLVAVATATSPPLDLATLHHLRGSPCRVRAVSSSRRGWTVSRRLPAPIRGVCHPHLRPLIHPCHPHYAAPPLHPLGRHFTHWADAVSALVGSCFFCLCCCCAQLSEFGSSRGLLRRLIVVAGPGRVKGAVSGRFADGNDVASRPLCGP